MATLDGMGLPVKIWPMPVEIPSPIRFDQDTVHQLVRSGVREPLLAHPARRSRACSRCRGATSSASAARCISSGARFDLAVTRFSGRARAAARGPGVHARGLLARGDQPRLLAGRRAGARAGVLRVRGAGAGRASKRRACEPDAAPSITASSANSSFRTRPSEPPGRPIRPSCRSSTAPTIRRRRLAAGIARRLRGRDKKARPR